MAKFLYISPFFPPVSRVGGLRPLKFARHLPALGWEPVILCDLWDGAPTDANLLSRLPDGLSIHRNYSPRAKQAWADFDATPRLPDALPGLKNMPEAAKASRRLPAFLRNRDWLPMGDWHAFKAHALTAARGLLDRHACKAIVVNADPVPALVVGRLLAEETGLPLISDLRDPWGPCELRRPLRPFYTRLIEDRHERKVMQASAKIIMNTEATREDYMRRYPEVPSDRFVTIRNHLDQELINAPAEGGYDRFTLLFLGTFSRFIRPDSFFGLLRGLKERGLTPQDLTLAVTEPLSFEDQALARNAGVFDYLTYQPPVSYRQVGALMDAADMLILYAPSRQRIQAKFYDYLASKRPILALADNHPELTWLLTATGAGNLFDPADIDNAADHVARLFKAGRHPEWPRNAKQMANMTSAQASRRLAALLNEVTGQRDEGGARRIHA